MEVSSDHDSTGRWRVTIICSPDEDDPSGTLSALVSTGRLEQALQQFGRHAAAGHAIAEAGEAELALEAIRDVLCILEQRRQSLLLAGRDLGLSWGELGKAAGLARQTVKRWVLRGQAAAASV